MFSLWQLGVFALLYVMVLFVIAWWGDRAERRGLRVVNNAWTYSLGLGVYCTSWTFYGAVGEASGNGCQRGQRGQRQRLPTRAAKSGTYRPATGS